MASNAEKASPAGTGTGLRKIDPPIVSENSLDALRAQYLASIFALPADTALVIAELAFGEGAR